MPTQFGKRFKRSGGRRLTRRFGEKVSYFKLDIEAGRKITARVERDGIEAISVSGTNSKAIIVTVIDCKCDGITAKELNTGGDELLVAVEVGDEPQRRTITRLLSDANGLVRFLVQ